MKLNRYIISFLFSFVVDMGLLWKSSGPPALLSTLFSLAIGLFIALILWRFDRRHPRVYQLPGCFFYIILFLEMSGFLALMDLARESSPWIKGWLLLPILVIELPFYFRHRYQSSPPNEDFRDVRRQPPFSLKGWGGKDDP